jgi:hypothetical protein
MARHLVANCWVGPAELQDFMTEDGIKDVA